MPISVQQLNDTIENVANEMYRCNYAKYTFFWNKPGPFELRNCVAFNQILPQLLRAEVADHDNFETILESIKKRLHSSTAVAKIREETAARFEKYDMGSDIGPGIGRSMGIATERFVDLFFTQFFNLTMDPRVVNFHLALRKKNSEHNLAYYEAQSRARMRKLIVDGS